MNCYKDVLDVLHAAQEEFYGDLALDKERVADLENTCDLLNGLASKFEAEYIDIEVDEASKVLSLSMEIDEMILRGEDMKSFLSVARKAIKVTMTSKNHMVFVQFDFGGLWSMV